MADIFLIRHTTPAVDKGICYGQTDLDVTESFEEEAAVIAGCLPAAFGAVYSSPLRRCSMLAGRLFPAAPVLLRGELMEVHCGEWEMRKWDELPREEMDPWMADFVNIRIPGGESYIDLHERVNRCWGEIVSAAGDDPVAVVAHGGVIRSILAELTGTPLIDSFKAFSLHYGCVIRLQVTADGWERTVLSNRAPAEKEQHKPSSFYKTSQP
ncbi:MAG TPA: alpha-ribazole phosphatase [Puia sp.]|uniref:alpha-ribazole phosphatase n=1 Tax=Puia sp. TaxID=2045100 RepID=UPI002B95AB1C|nr:alpha-ribazole phosphatase [Puia sp.]HVU98985.1 alpha-ribazole phosphatase [Puia sp.]